MPSILENATFKFGTVSLLIGAVASGVWTVAVRLTRLEAKVDASYSIAQASEQALRMALENPGFRVPDPRDPNNIFIVKPNSGSGTGDRYP